MAYRPLDWLAAAAWTARAPDDTASAELDVAADAARTRFGTGASLRLTATADALDHRAERAVPAEDLTDVDELRLWIYATRVGDGGQGRPLYAELRLASAAVGFDDAANTWHRRLPVTRARTWELVRLRVDDLPAGVRGAVTAVRLACVDASLAFTLHLDALFAAREAPIADVEAALLERFDGTITAGGEAVAAVLYHTTGVAPPAPPGPPARPQLRVRHEAVRPAAEGVRPAAARRDYTGDGFSLAAGAVLYDLIYAFEPFCDGRAQEAELVEALLRALAPRGELVVGGVPVPVEWLDAEPSELLGHRLALRFRIRTHLPTGPAPPVVPVEGYELDLDYP